MLFEKNILEYLEGKTFSNGGVITLRESNTHKLNRDDYLIELVKDKTILHLGFLDHLPLIDDKIKNKNWLHNKLVESSKLCVGIDINEEGIKYLENKYKMNDIYCIDIVNDNLPNDIANIKFDYLLIPDVIEHISNPQQFLFSIKEKLKDSVKEVVVTTPNAFRWNNFINTFKNSECINTDHRFWFTPYTLSKIMYDSKYEVEKIDYLEHGRLSRREIIKKMILKKYPAFRDTLVLVGLFKNE